MLSTKIHHFFVSWMIIQTVLSFTSGMHTNSSVRKFRGLKESQADKRNVERYPLTLVLHRSPSLNHYLQRLYSYKYSCKYFGRTCETERREAKKYTKQYYDYARKQKLQKHKDIYGKPYDGVSYVDPRPAGEDRYVDYKEGITTNERPPHGHYGILPYPPALDPTCEEIKNIVDKCEGKYSKICGFGTRWNPYLKQCVQMNDNYMSIYGTSQPYYRSIYPTIRPYGEETCFDNPDDIYLYLTQEQQHVWDSVPHGTDTCKICRANRCRFPLTSIQGQNQAEYYVRLFREVYEYSGDDVNKEIRRTRIRTLIDNHASFFSNGIHGFGDFLPWHRWYILEMENILMQHQYETVTTYGCEKKFVGIPYFDWHNLKNGETPKEFINNAKDPAGHHFHGSLGQDSLPSAGCVTSGALSGFVLTDGACLERAWINAIAEEDPENDLHPVFPFPLNYDQLRNTLEAGTGLHGEVHGIIGGTMNSIRSANDPIFFTHHGNIDKIWGDWQEQSSAHKMAYTGITTLTNLMPGSTATPVQMLDLSNLIFTPSAGSATVSVSVEYVDVDTSSMWGDGTSKSI